MKHGYNRAFLVYTVVLTCAFGGYAAILLGLIFPHLPSMVQATDLNPASGIIGAATLPTATWNAPGMGLIVFSTGKGNTVSIDIMNVDGSNRHQLRASLVAFSYPQWSPNGQQIAFVSALGGEQQVAVMDADGTDMRILQRGTMPAWSPDGKRIAFVVQQGSSPPTSSEIFVMNADGSHILQLTHDVEQQNTFPAWSPDGQYLVFTGQSAATNWGYETYVMDADGSHTKRLTFHPDPNNPYGSYGPATWSPDGKQIAFGSTLMGVIQVFIMDADGSDLKQVTTDMGLRAFSPVWSSDGQHLIYCATHESGSQSKDGIFIADVDGSTVKRLTSMPYDCFPSVQMPPS